MLLQVYFDPYINNFFWIGYIGYTHFGEMVADAVDMRAEVAVITRSVVFQGDVLDECPEFNDNCDEMDGMDTFGGHIKVGLLWYGFSLLLLCV